MAEVLLASSRIIISDIGEDKSFADDLNKERGIVSSRVDVELRSAEIKPLFHRFVLGDSPKNISHPLPLWGECPEGPFFQK